MDTLARTKVKDLLKMPAGADVLAKGWVRTKRGNKQIKFIALNDGSTINNIQVVADMSVFDEELMKRITTGASLKVTGKLVESVGSGQAVEIQASGIEVYGECDPMRYPLQKKDTSLEYLRSVAHMRLRTNTFGAVLRIRHAMAFAIHKFFNDKGFVYLNTPLITESDAEGAGDMFQVTTMNLENVPKHNGKVDFSKDFFGKKTSLTVSGQLEGELGATAVGEIYTFGPTFRAENSNTPRHLAEFWMIEPEIAFLQLDGLMALEEDFIKYCVRWALDNCQDDLEFLNKMIDKTLIERLQGVLKEDFVRLPYTEGIRILQEAIKNGHKFEFPCNWGDDLASEHERYLVEEHFRKPVIMTDYPSSIKAFYMKQNTPQGEGSVGYKGSVAPGPTMQGTDVLFPAIGEIIGGSVREEDFDKLMAEINHRQMDTTTLDWYLDTRRWGSCPHAGFGLGFERLILFVTGMQNIRDVIPFPRTPKNAAF